MTTKSSIRNLKSKLASSPSVHTMTTNGNNESKCSRITIKKPLSTATFLPNNSATNGFSTQLKKRTLQLNNFFHSKLKSSHSSDQTNSAHSTEHSPSPPLVFHAIAPTSSEENNNHHEHKIPILAEIHKKPQSESQSLATRRIANVLNHTNIKAMSSDLDDLHGQSSCSDEDESHLNSRSVEVDADADESDDDDVKRPKKSRRMQKPRKTDNCLSIQKSDHTNGKLHLSSSNEDDKEQPLTNGNNDRKLKSSSAKTSDHITSPTTTDDDVTRTIHLYHPLDILQQVSTPSPTINPSVNQSSTKKPNRFQVNTIRKSQQQQILMENAMKARASTINEEDCSVPHQTLSSQSKALTIERKNTNTPTTDGENSTVNSTNVIQNSTSTSIPTESGHHHHHHHVRFQAALQGKPESTTEEEKVSNQSVIQTTSTTTPVPTPAPALSTVSAHGEDDEEGEAIAKSPDERFIKYAKEIGRGAFKTVYRGLDTETSVAVAWCELQDFAQFDKHERARFKEEAEMLKKLQHPNIVRFYDFWEETNPRTNKKVIILVTELMTSGSLKGYIRKFKGQKEEKRINVMKKWCRQILKGLAYLHSRNPPVIHRDLKCDNVFVSSTTGCVKIGDLGLATFKTQTFAKSMRGTMEFMAPEMFDEQYDELVDIYSFGLCMLEMITGEYPYIECKGPTAVIKRVTAGLKPDCYYKVENEDVREVIDCCIRTNKSERLSVHELLQHSFFLDDNGLRIDFVRDTANDSQVVLTNNSKVVLTNNSIDLKLKIIDKSKRKALWTEHEAIRFRFNFTTETPEEIVNELIEKKYILEDDKKFVLQSIKDRFRAYQYEQIDRKAGVFCRDAKPTVNHTHQPSLLGQSQPSQQVVTSVPQQLQLPPTTPLIIPQQVTSMPAATPTPTIVSQPSIDASQQQQQQHLSLSITKPTGDLSQPKPIVTTEPIPIPPIAELSSSVSNSAGSLEKLDAALKITLFNKTKPSQSISTPSTIANDISEPPTPIMVQDESSTTRSVDDQRQVKESGGAITSDLATNIFQSTTPVTAQTQSQPTTMLTSHQPHILQNPLLLTQTPSSYPYSTMAPTPHLINTTLASDPLKQLAPPPPSSSTTSSTATPTPSTAETIENSHASLSSPYIHEAIQSSLSSDASLPNQPQMPDSLKHLDALLKNALKNTNKPTGTAQASDSETSNTTIPQPPTGTNETSTKLPEIETDEAKVKVNDPNNTSNSTVSSIFHSQPSTSSIILPVPIQQNKPQSASYISTHPKLSVLSDGNIHELEILLKSPQNRSLSNDDTIVSSSNELTDIKSMIGDLSRTLLTRMNTIESKIDEHRNQTMQINNLLTTTVLPSLVDLAAIIDENPNLDSRIRMKLEHIRTTVRSTQQQQQQQQTEMKDLMEI
ncbi:unnamed protein product [Adineta ricciae]|uniref:non-specific serine/threonine protein kinase n=1 Tax=Adineta ricciae TaxID=249248 RepID=A0A814MFX0_ADIRI|nr:unnamed protein product [Adineta ricciae]